MTYANFFDSLETHFEECEVEKCKEKRCEIKCDKNKFKYFILFKGEKIVEKLNENIKICDCFIYCNFDTNNSLIVALVELKSKSIRPSKIKEKFDNSAKKVKYMVNFCNGVNITKIKFFPILLYKSVNPIDIKAISRFKIRFEKDYSIIYGKCGSNLLDIIEKYTL